MISVATQRAGILRIVGISTYVSVRLVFARSEVRALLRVTTFAIIFQHFDVGKVVSSCSCPVFFNGDRCEVCPYRLLVRVLFANVQVDFTLIAMFIGREDNVCRRGASNDSFLLGSFNVVAAERQPTAARVNVVRRDLHVAPMFVVSRSQGPICRRLKVAMGRLMINRPRQVIGTTRAFGVIRISNYGCALKAGGVHRFSRRLNCKLLIVVAIASRVINRVGVRLFLRSFPVLQDLNARVRTSDHAGSNGPCPYRCFFRSSGRRRHFRVLVFEGLFLGLRSFSHRGVLPT